MTKPTEKQLDSLPKWAQRHIRELTSRVEHAEMTTPWTKPGMEWFTLFRPPHRPPNEVKLFVCDENGTRPIVTIGESDFLFVGRGPK